MRIGIDITQIMYGTGVSRYTEELVKNLLAIDKKNEYIFLFSSLRQQIQNLKIKMQKDNAKFKIFRLPPTLLEILWNKLHIINVENFIGRVDIFHSSDWIQPPACAKKVTTVHDLSFLRFPQTFPKKIIQVQKRRLKWVKKECDLVIADSVATKEDLVKLLGFEENKIRVVYLGVNHKLQTTTQDLKLKYKLSDKYLLYIGTLQPRKNLIRLIEAFHMTRKQSGNETIQLVIAGRKGWMYESIFKRAKSLGLENNVIFTGYVTEEEETELLKKALCFIYPSLYEGFGLPVLEAMAAGCPVITSNISSLPEVVGSAGILIDPLDTKQIAQAMKKVLLDNSLRQRMIKTGKQQAEKFSWRKTAQETLKVYEELNS